MENTFTIASNGDYIEIAVINYAYLNSQDTYDKNWLNVVITIKAGAFSGKFKAFFQTSDFVGLFRYLSEAYDNLSKEYKFTTLEEQLEIEFIGDGFGHINIDAVAQDQAGIGNTLNFELRIDQTDVKTLIHQLDIILKEYLFR
ncbi:MAG: hypothetical protein J7502_09400 [Flavisolibacter sp.]|nr:hypothetical protein [Flavisolibacter sp.]